MGVFSSFFNTESRSFFEHETRSSLENPQTPLSFPAEWLLDIYNGGRTDSGIRVSQLSALQQVTLKSCVELVARAVAALPFHIYEIAQNKNGHITRKVAYDHQHYDVTHSDPNPEMTHMTLFTTNMAHALLWANAYIEIIWSTGGDILALLPRNPGKTRAYRLLLPLTIDGETHPRGELVYVTTDGISDYDQSEQDAMGLERAERVILAENMLHIPGLSLDGRIGLDVIEYARNTIGRKLAMEKYASKFFGNGGRSSLIIKLPGNMSKEQRDKVRQSYQEALGGENMMRPIVLTSGVEIQPIEIKQNEAQFNESETAMKEDICSMFHVPPHMVGMTEKTSRANTEQLAQEFYQFCILPWLEAIKQEWKRKLLTKPAATGRPGKKYIFDFDVDTLLRPDADSRQKFISTMFSVGAWSPNRILEYNGENPLDNDDADKTYVPVNMIELGTPVADPNAPGNNPANPKVGDGAPDETEKKSLAFADRLTQRYVSVYLQLWKDAFQRSLVKKSNDSKALYRTFAPLLTSICADVAELAAHDFKVESVSNDAFSTLVKEYTGSMSKRYNEWTETSCESELQRAIKAIIVTTYREIGTARGKAFAGQFQLREAQPE